MKSEQTLTRDQRWIYKTFIDTTKFAAQCAIALEVSPSDVPELAERLHQAGERRFNSALHHNISVHLAN